MPDHLGQDDGHEGPGPGIPQHLSRLPLTCGDGVDAAPVDLRKVGGIVQHEADDHGDEAVTRSCICPEKVIGTEEHHQELQHQRSSPHDGDIELHEKLQRSYPGHASEGHQQPQGQSSHQGEDIDEDAFPHAAQEHFHHGSERHKRHSERKDNAAAVPGTGTAAKRQILSR